MIHLKFKLNPQVLGMVFGVLFFWVLGSALASPVEPSDTPVAESLPGSQVLPGPSLYFQNEWMQGTPFFFKVQSSLYETISARFKKALWGEGFSELKHSSCPICYRNFDEQDRWVITRCHHLFCHSCLSQWSQFKTSPTKMTCPVCRKAQAWVGALELIKKGDHVIELRQERIQIHQPYDWIYTPSFERIKALPGYTIPASVFQPRRVLEGGWKFPETISCLGCLRNGMRLYPRVRDEQGALPYENVDRNQAEGVCFDPNQSNLGLMTRRDLKALRKLLDIRDISLLRSNARVQEFFETHIFGGAGVFWLADRSDRFDYAFDEQLNELPLPKDSGRAAVVCFSH
jgi:hypothetical protein